MSQAAIYKEERAPTKYFRRSNPKGFRSLSGIFFWAIARGG